MKVLLAHSYFLKNDAKQVKKMRPYPPLGTLYAAGHLRERGFEVALFDAMLAESESEFESLLDLYKPAVVALYEDQFNFLNKMCLTHSREAACRMSLLARSRGATVIAAGSDVSDCPEVYFGHGVQHVLTGEADHTLVELCEALRDGRPGAADTLAGLALPGHNGNGARRTAARPPERRPDVFPLPAWDLVDVERYQAAWRGAHGYFSVNMVSTRGCPFHCNWCAKPIWGQLYAMRSPGNVAEELAVVKRTVRPDHIWFADDIFGLQAEWVRDFAEEVAARDAAVPFTIQSRVDLMKEDAVVSLARAGCREVWLGAESGSQKILDAMDKGTTVEQIRLARKTLGKYDIRACFFIQFGYPGETFDDILSTVGLVRETMPSDVGISVSYPLPGTKFHAMVKNELAGKDHWTDSNDLAMMYEGTYETDFYRGLHDLLHEDLETRQQVQEGKLAGEIAAAELQRIDQRWTEMAKIEPQKRTAKPTKILKTYSPAEAPDLTRSWN